MASRRKGRILAFQALYCWEAVHAKTEELLSFLWLEEEKREALGEEVCSFSRLLISGTIENIISIDSMIKKHLENWDINRLNRVDLAIIRMSVYTLLYQKEIAPSIIIDEAISISKKFGTDESFRFINGVLDSVNKSINQKTEKEK